MRHRHPYRFETTLALIGACALSLASCGGAQTMPSEPLENTTGGAEPDEQAAKDPSKGHLDIACGFDDGWVAILPEGLMESEDDDFLMQALIGFATEPQFWATIPEYQKYEAHAARRCEAGGTAHALEPGNYVMLVGWAGQFEQTHYTNNGRIEALTIQAGESVERRINTDDLDRDMPCISCPFLLVLQDGKFVELGQILIDRYIASKQGTDARATRADVKGGLITVQLAEREPEVSYIDSIEVWYEGKALMPASTVPAALRVVDGSYHTLAMGDSVTLQFHAPIDEGSLPVEIRVNGYYILDIAR